MEEGHGVSFGPYRLVGSRGPLLRYSHEVNVPPKAIAALWQLVTRAGAVVTKEELLSTVWAGTVVGEEALTSCLRRLRRALQDDAERPRYIATVHGIGYRFIRQVVSRQPTVVRRKPTTSSSRESGAQSPSFLSQPSGLGTRHALHSLVVGRDAELAQLHHLFEKALHGQRQMVFVTGEAGIGKTALVEAFLQRLESRVSRSEERQKAQSKKRRAPRATNPRSLTLDLLSRNPRFPLPDPWVAWGQCIEHYGAGEAYLPMLEIVGRLCRMGGEGVVALLRQHAPTWLLQLPMLLNEADAAVLPSRVVGATRERMLREITEALEAISVARPLVLALEDLHWSDASTVEVLNMLARRREAARLLVLGTVRPVDLIVNTHPLKHVKQDLATRGLAVEIALPYLHPDAVQAYVARQTDALGDHASEVGSLLYERTEGHPLFMVHLLAALKRQAVPLAEARRLLPPGLQQLLSAQIERLTPTEQAVLEAGSVVGAEFSVASVAAGGERAVEEIEALCEHLARQGQFITERELGQWPDGTVSGRYGFRHALYQEVLYQRLSGSRRARLHRRIGLREEAAYGERANEIAVELAMHFERGKDQRRAVRYLQRAGENAVKRNAYQEAVMLMTRALDLLHSWSDTLERAHQELVLQLALGRSLMMHKGYAALEVEHVYTRALALCRADTPPPLRFSVLSGLATFWIARGEFVRARDLADQCLDLARQMTSPPRQLQSQTLLGMISLYLGEPLRACAYLEPGVTLAETSLSLEALTTIEVEATVSCLAYTAVGLWMLGYPEQASKRSDEALTLSRRLGRPSILALAFHVACWVYRDRRDVETTQARVEALLTLCHEYVFPFWFAWGQTSRGWVLTEQGSLNEGIQHVQRSLALLQTAGATGGLSDTLALLAEAYGRLGQPETGLTLLTQALNYGTEKGERYYEAEVYRLKGELLLQQRTGKRDNEPRG